MSAGSHPLSPSDAYSALGYLGLCWDPVAESASLRRILAALAVEAPRLKLQLSHPGLMVFGEADAPRWSVDGDREGTLALIGTAFDTASLGEAGAARAQPDCLAGMTDLALLRAAWGGFVAIRRRGGASGWTFLREPGGTAPALIAEGAGLVLLAPSLPRWLREAAGMAPRIDVPMLARALFNPLLPTWRSLLQGVHQLPAGCAIDWDGHGIGAARTLWPGPEVLSDPVPENPTAPAHLRSTVIGCVRALAARHQRVTLELSGGLDSAIVLGALASAPEPIDISCVNFAVAHAGGDERSEARAVADRWGVRMIEVAADARELRFEDLLLGEQPVEPVLFGLDPILERASVGVAQAFDSHAIFTGQGGDAIFCNLPTPLVAVDHARAMGWRAFGSRVAYDAAMRAHCSIWRVHALMLVDRFAPLRPPPQSLPGMQLGARAAALAGPLSRHPWLAGDAGMAPARRMQLGAIANCQHFHSPTWRSGAAALVHPLLARPIVEACLAIPTYRLAQGSGNRALARQLFADWLPECVRTRRDKGDATNYYRRAVAENVPFLRELLLDGVLVAHGLLDGAGIDTALSDASLIWSYESRLIVAYASFEAWARYWGLERSGDSGAFRVRSI